MDIPDTSQAEKWVTPETFIYQRKLYKVTDNFQIVRVADKRAGSKAATVKQESK